MTPQDVRQRMELYLGYLREEQEIRDQLTALNFMAPNEKELQKVMTKQSELMDAIETIRQEKMLPILTELAEFIAKARTALALQ